MIRISHSMLVFYEYFFSSAKIMCPNYDFIRLNIKDEFDNRGTVQDRDFVQSGATRFNPLQLPMLY